MVTLGHGTAADQSDAKRRVLMERIESGHQALPWTGACHGQGTRMLQRCALRDPLAARCRRCLTASDFAIRSACRASAVDPEGA
jgi:hypothetical protein